MSVFWVLVVICVAAHFFAVPGYVTFSSGTEKTVQVGSAKSGEPSLSGSNLEGPVWIKFGRPMIGADPGRAFILKQKTPIFSRNMKTEVEIYLTDFGV